MRVMKRAGIIVLPLIMILAACIYMNQDQVNASEYYHFKAPKAGKVFTAGDKINVKVYAGMEKKTTNFDEWGRPSTVEYQDMNVKFEVVKGKKVIYEDFASYQQACTLTFPYVPDIAGKLQLRIYGDQLDLNSYEQIVHDTLFITVKKKKAAAVKKIKPAASVTRIDKKKCVIKCNKSYAFGMKVYRSLKKNGKYKLIKTVNDKEFTDTKLLPNKAYFYRIRLFAKSGKKTFLSKWSKTYTASKIKGSVLPVIKSVTYSKEKGYLIKWKHGIKVDKYFVLRTDSPTDEGGLEVATVKGNVYQAYDNDLEEMEKGKTYYYRVFGVKDYYSMHPLKFLGKKFAFKAQ